MGKNPAFLFYSADFLNGCVDLTMEERGQYITMLCLQHQKGSLSEKTIRLCLGSVSVDVLSKFDRDENGNYVHKRLQEELVKRDRFVESRINNGFLGGRPKIEKKPIGYPLGYPSGKPKNNLMENENEDVIESIKDPVLKSKFKQLFKTPKWTKKKRSALEAAVKKSENYETGFMIDLIDKAIIGEYQGLFFSNTDQDYQKYLKSSGVSEIQNINYGQAD